MHAWVMGILRVWVSVRRSLYLRTLRDGVVADGLTTVIYVVGRMRRGHWGLIMTLIRVATGSVMGVRLHAGGNVLGLSNVQSGKRLYTPGTL